MGNAKRGLVESRGGLKATTEGRAARLLLVEDDPGQIELALTGLGDSRGGLDVMVVRTLAAAKNAEVDFKPDIALVSATLPDGRGTALVPDDLEAARYPIVLMIGPGEEHLATEAIEMGVIDYLVKSDRTFVDFAHLVQRVLRVWTVMTENRRSSRALELSERRFRAAKDERTKLAAAIEHSEDAIIVLDVDGVVEDVNPAFERITGDARAELLGRTPAILRRGEHDERFYAELWRNIKRRESWVGRLVDTNKRKEELVVDARVDSIVDDGDKIIGYIGVLRDVTEKTNLEQNLRQARKMEAIGTLAGGIAHDFNNILYAIGGFIELAQLSEHTPASDAPRYLEEAFKATQRAKQLVSQILAFSRKSEQERRPVRLDLLVKEMSRLLRATIPSTIRITTRIDVSDPLVSADPSQLHQIIMNLCTNAAYAMRDRGGEMEVALEPVESASAHKAAVRLLVRDTGAGMSEEVTRRIFEPFFTTKPADEGTGMGLSVVMGIVESLGGTIQVASEPGVGTTFWVELPVSREVAQGPVLTKPPEPTVGIAPGKRVLVVDDEPDITEIMGAILARAGFEVETARDGQEAWRRYREDDRGFDVIISDQTMPGMTGGELAQKILELDPRQPIILCTGYSEKLNEEEAQKIGVKQLLLKPVRNKNLLEAVEKALGESS